MEDITTKLNAAKDSFDRTPEEKLSIDELSEKLNLSKEHFIRAFKNNFGSPPGNYRQNRRMEKAAALLLNSNMKINAIAEKTGFENIFYFSRAFKKHFAIPPGQYREKHAQD